MTLCSVVIPLLGMYTPRLSDAAKNHLEKSILSNEDTKFIIVVDDDLDAYCKYSVRGLLPHALNPNAPKAAPEESGVSESSGALHARRNFLLSAPNVSVVNLSEFLETTVNEVKSRISAFYLDDKSEIQIREKLQIIGNLCRCIPIYARFNNVDIIRDLLKMFCCISNMGNGRDDSVLVFTDAENTMLNVKNIVQEGYNCAVSLGLVKLGPPLNGYYRINFVRDFIAMKNLHDHLQSDIQANMTDVLLSHLPWLTKENFIFARDAGGQNIAEHKDIKEITNSFVTAPVVKAALRAVGQSDAEVPTGLLFNSALKLRDDQTAQDVMCLFLTEGALECKGGSIGSDIASFDAGFDCTKLPYMLVEPDKAIIVNYLEEVGADMFTGEELGTLSTASDGFEDTVDGITIDEPAASVVREGASNTLLSINDDKAPRHASENEISSHTNDNDEWDKSYENPCYRPVKDSVNASESTACEDIHTPCRLMKNADSKDSSLNTPERPKMAHTSVRTEGKTFVFSPIPDGPPAKPIYQEEDCVEQDNFGATGASNDAVYDAIANASVSVTTEHSYVNVTTEHAYVNGSSGTYEEVAEFQLSSLQVPQEENDCAAQNNLNERKELGAITSSLTSAQIQVANTKKDKKSSRCKQM